MRFALSILLVLLGSASLAALGCDRAPKTDGLKEWTAPDHDGENRQQRVAASNQGPKGSGGGVPALVEIAIGRKPRLATSAVVRTGRSRSIAPSRAASGDTSPACRRSTMVLTSTTPFRTAMPQRAIKPTAAEILNGKSRSHSASTPPVAAKGMFTKINSDSRMLRNMM